MVPLTKLTGVLFVAVFAASLAASPLLAQQKPPPPFSWIIAENGQLPRGALIAGTENNQPIAACRILMQGALYAGRLTNGACRVGVMGREVADKRYEVFVADARAIAWLHSAQIDRLPAGAIAGGYEPGPRVNILCRTQLPTGMAPGRFNGKGCIVANANAEVTTSSFEVAALAPQGSIVVRSAAIDSNHDVFIKNMTANRAAIQTEFAAARVPQSLAQQMERLDSLLGDIARMGPPPPPTTASARALTPHYLALMQADETAQQIEALLGGQPTTPATGLLLALLAKQRQEILTFMADVG